MDTIELFKSIAIGGGATTIATQILKQTWIPIPFERYPRATAIIVSLISSAIAVYQTDGTIFTQEGLLNWLAVGVGIVVVAVIAYANIIKQIPGSKTVL